MSTFSTERLEDDIIAMANSVAEIRRALNASLKMTSDLNYANDTLKTKNMELMAVIAARDQQLVALKEKAMNHIAKVRTSLNEIINARDAQISELKEDIDSLNAEINYCYTTGHTRTEAT